MSKKLYVQLTQEQLIISLLKKTKDKSFLVHPKTIKLKFCDVQNKAIYNTSAIYLHIKKYLQENKIKKVKAIICSPRILKLGQNTKNLFLLQLILCCSKANLLIEKIIGKTILKNTVLKNGENMTFFANDDLSDRLDFFKQFKPPHKNNSFKWLTTTSLILILMIFAQFKLQKAKTKKLYEITKKINIEKNQNDILQKQLQQIHLTQQQNKKLEQQKEKIIKTNKKQNNPQNILFAISKSIPNNCWIENLKINYSLKNKKTKQKTILLQGKALENKDVLNFMSKLSKTSKIKNLKIKSIKKEKLTYSFSISGAIGSKSAC